MATSKVVARSLHIRKLVSRTSKMVAKFAYSSQYRGMERFYPNATDIKFKEGVIDALLSLLPME
jgi:hypothetical protein